MDIPGLLDLYATGAISRDYVIQSMGFTEEDKNIMATYCTASMQERLNPLSTSSYFDDLYSFKVLIHGYNCSIVKDSELYFKISDFLTWMILKSIDDNFLVLSSIHYNNGFFRTAERLLSSELSTLVQITKIEVCKNYMQASNDIFFLVKIDQEYINSYTDTESNKLIEEMIGNL